MDGLKPKPGNYRFFWRSQKQSLFSKIGFVGSKVKTPDLSAKKEWKYTPGKGYNMPLSHQYRYLILCFLL